MSSMIAMSSTAIRGVNPRSEVLVSKEHVRFVAVV